MDSFDERAIPVSGNAFKVVSDILGKCKVGRVPFPEAADKWRKQASLRLIRRLCRKRPLGHADEAEPWLIQLTRIFVQRWIEAREVERTVAPIAAQEESAAATRGTKVVVLRKLVILRQIMFCVCIEHRQESRR
jgi:hypothetical protein